MAIIETKILGTNYSLACSDGEENRLLNLVHKLNNRLKKISSANPKANEVKLLVLSALVLEDELEDTKTIANKELGKEESEAELVMLMESISHYIENLTGKIKNL